MHIYLLFSSTIALPFVASARFPHSFLAPLSNCLRPLIQCDLVNGRPAHVNPPKPATAAPILFAIILLEVRHGIVLASSDLCFCSRAAKMRYLFLFHCLRRAADHFGDGAVCRSNCLSLTPLTIALDDDGLSLRIT